MIEIFDSHYKIKVAFREYKATFTIGAKVEKQGEVEEIYQNFLDGETLDIEDLNKLQKEGFL